MDILIFQAEKYALLVTSVMQGDIVNAVRTILAQDRL